MIKTETNSTPSLRNFFAPECSIKRTKTYSKKYPQSPGEGRWYMAGLVFFQGIADIFWQPKERLRFKFVPAKKFHNDAVVQRFFLFSLFFLRMQMAFAQCDSGDCQYGKGFYKFPNGDTYNGYWQAGRMFGYGIYSYHNGDKYEGDMMDDTMNGKGKWYWAAGNVKFSGLFFQGEPVILDTARKNQCIMGDCTNGVGLQMFEHGCLFLGYWKNYHINDYGIYYYEDGSAFYGHIYHNNEEGYGVNLFHSGDVYVGNWHDAKEGGKGKYIFKNGQYYIGGWQDALRTGQGTLYNKDGSIAMTGTWLYGNCTPPPKEVISFDTGFSTRLHKIISYAIDSFKEVRGADIGPGKTGSEFFSNFSLMPTSEDFILNPMNNGSYLKAIDYSSILNVDSAYLEKDYTAYLKKITKCLGKGWKKTRFKDPGNNGKYSYFFTKSNFIIYCQMHGKEQIGVTFMGKLH